MRDGCLPVAPRPSLAYNGVSSCHPGAVYSESFAKRKQIMSLKLENLVTLFDYLSPWQYRSVDQVAGKLGVDRRTVFRYMTEIELAFDPVPVIERDREGYRLCQSDFLDVMQSREDYAGLAAVMSSPLGALVQGKRPMPDKLLKGVREMVDTRAALGEKLVRPIFEAMRTGNFLELGYHSASETKTHLCVPVKFFIRSGIPYVVVFDEARGHLIVLGADKIERVAKSRKSLPPSTVQELRAYVNSAWGMMIQHREGRRIEVEFEANASVAPYFEKAPLHSSQTMTERRGKHVFRLLVHNEKEFGRYLLRFGRAVRILSPESAIDELTGFLSEMEAFYAGKTPVKEQE